MLITTEQANELVQALDLEDHAIRGDYSGRGMYGRTCFGITLDRGDGANEVLLGVALAQVFGADDAWDIGRAMRTDSMGMGTIVYFPGWDLEGTEDDEEEDLS